MQCGAMYVYCVMVILWILTRFEVIQPCVLNSVRRQGMMRAVPWLLILGFITACMAGLPSQQYESTSAWRSVLRLVIIFGALPFLCERWISPSHVRLCILLITSFVIITYSSLEFKLLGTISMSLNDLESVQGDVDVGITTMSLIRTFTGPILAIANCTMMGLFMSERRLLLRLLCFVLLACGTVAVLYTGARGALGVEVVVCLCVGLMVLIRKKSLTNVIILSIGVMVLLYVVQRVAPSALYVLNNRLDNTELSLASYDRLYRWKWALEFFLSHPMGSGWTLAPLGMEAHAHNDGLIMAMSFGVFGLAAYSVAFMGEWLFIIKKRPMPSVIWLESYLPSLACLMALFLSGFMDMILAVGQFFEVAWLIVVLAHAAGSHQGVDS
jgi:hypothetical protein